MSLNEMMNSAGLENARIAGKKRVLNALAAMQTQVMETAFDYAKMDDEPKWSNPDTLHDLGVECMTDVLKSILEDLED